MLDDRRTRHTRSRIRQAFLKCLQTTSLEKVTVVQICKVADINRSTFYAHYADPMILYHQLEDEMLAQMENAISDFQNQRIPYREMLKRELACFSENREVFLALAHSRSDVFRSIHKNLIQRYDFLSDLSSDEDREIAEEYYISGLLSVYTYWLSTDNRQDIDYMADLLVKLTKNRIP